MAKKATPKKRLIKGKDYNEDKRQDGLRSAKSFGWRKAGTSRKPTKKEIKDHYDGASNGVYMENRPERGDNYGRAKKGERFEQGGEVNYNYEKGKNYPVKTVSKDDYEKLGLEDYPNFSKTGSISGMKKQYYGKDALLVKCGNYIYNVTSNPDIYFNEAYEKGGEIESEEYKKGGKIDRKKSAKKTRINRTKKAIAQDKNIKALHGGKRISESGSVYYESRPNRSDENRTKKLAKGGDLKNYTSADLPKDGSAIEIHMPAMGKFPAEDIVLKYNQDNFAFDAYRNGELSGTRITEKQVLDNLNNGSYEFKNKSEDSDELFKEGDKIAFNTSSNANNKRLEGTISKDKGLGLVVKSDNQVFELKKLIDVEKLDEYAKGGEVGGRGFFGLEKGDEITDLSVLKEGDIILAHSNQFNADNTLKVTGIRTYGTNSNYDVVYWNPKTNKRIGDEEMSISDINLGTNNYFFPLNYEKGGKLGFEGLAKKVAKEYEGDKVKPEYQDEYGKRYDKEEAKEVGQKVAAKVYREQQGMMEKGGEIKSTLSLSEIESKLGKTFGFWSVPYQVTVDGVEYRKKFGSNIYNKI